MVYSILLVEVALLSGRHMLFQLRGLSWCVVTAYYADGEEQVVECAAYISLGWKQVDECAPHSIIIVRNVLACG